MTKYNILPHLTEMCPLTQHTCPFSLLVPAVGHCKLLMWLAWFHVNLQISAFGWLKQEV